MKQSTKKKIINILKKWEGIDISTFTVEESIAEVNKIGDRGSISLPIENYEIKITGCKFTKVN